VLFSQEVLKIDPEQTIQMITASIRAQLSDLLHRRGAVVAVSGGIDSAVCVALCARAVGRDNVLALLLPEKESSQESTALGKLVVESLEIPFVVEDITAVLESMNCYSRRMEAVQQVVPEYGKNWKCKIVIPSYNQHNRLNVFRLVVQSPNGQRQTVRIPLAAYLQVVASTNMKQRTRKSLEYYHADRLNYAVCGTPNRLEYDQGFFVKNGDGSADFKPIAHLYKTQVYQLGRVLGIPDAICSRTPTTDTYPLDQTQEEFFFALPYEKMDLCLYGYTHGVSSAEVGASIGLSAEQVGEVYHDIESKRRATRYLHLQPLLVEDVPGIVHDVAELQTVR
jgi:NAD+ synthase